MNNQNKKVFADLYIESGNEKVIIEVKNSIRQTPDIIKDGTEQLLKYLQLTMLSNGILYIPQKKIVKK